MVDFVLTHNWPNEHVSNNLVWFLFLHLAAISISMDSMKFSTIHLLEIQKNSLNYVCRPITIVILHWVILRLPKCFNRFNRLMTACRWVYHTKRLCQPKSMRSIHCRSHFIQRKISIWTRALQPLSRRAHRICLAWKWLQPNSKQQKPPQMNHQRNRPKRLYVFYALKNMPL